MRLSLPSITETCGIMSKEIKRSVVASPTVIIFLAFFNIASSLLLVMFLSRMRSPKGSFKIRIHSGVRGIMRLHLVKFCFIFFLCIHLCGNYTYSSCHCLGDVDKCMRLHRIRFRYCNRFSMIAAFHNMCMKGDLANKRYIELLAYSLTTSFSKYVNMFVAMRTLQVTHVFDNTNDRNI